LVDIVVVDDVDDDDVVGKDGMEHMGRCIGGRLHS
jgi:hypothetical protein